jgi:hypothetical protein
MIQNTATSRDTRVGMRTESTAFAAFGMHEVDGDTLDAAIAPGARIASTAGRHGHARFAAAVADARSKPAGTPRV